MFLLRCCVERNQPHCFSRRYVLAAPILIALGCSMLASSSSAGAARTQRLLSLRTVPKSCFCAKKRGAVPLMPFVLHYISQSCISMPGILERCLVLWVTMVMRLWRAVLPISKSISSILLPRDSSATFTSP